MTGRRKGFALLAVLWIIAGASLLSMAATLDGREAIDGARNRINDVRAYWFAYACTNGVLAEIDSALATGEATGSAADAWRTLNEAAPTASTIGSTPCSVSMKSAGSRLDVNAASREQLHALFNAMARPDADALSDALFDWRDADDEELPLGAEAARYMAAERPVPRNGPLASIHELAHVRGFENVALFDTVLDVEPGRVSISTAPITVLASVPGFTDELLAQIAQKRAAGKQITDLLNLAAAISPADRDSLLRHYDEVMRLTTIDPDAWIITSRGYAGLPMVSVTLESRIVRTGLRAAVVRFRAWR